MTHFSRSIRTRTQARIAGILSLFAVAVAAAIPAHAQTAPQLLPYTSRLIAGGGTATVASGGTCPLSGNKSTDAYGDGCLATEIELGNTASGGSTPGARSAVADANGNVFFTDYNAGLVRRVDAVTGVVTAVAGGATSSPAAGATCGTSASTDAAGDGCLGTLVKLSHPAGIAFAPNGDLYFSDTGNANVRKIAATAGFITTSGVISLIAGNVSGTYGYAASNATTTINIGSASSYLHFPYGISFDTKGDLFIVDEYTEAILVANTSTTTNVVNGVSVPAGTIYKIAGSLTANTVTYCTNGAATAGTVGCAYGLYVENVAANGDQFDSTYAVGVGPDGTVYAADEYYDSIFQVSPAGILSTFAGKQNSVGAKPTIGNRGVAGSFGIGSPFGVAADPTGNVYFGDASSGVIWRVDNAGKLQYVVAGGATTACSAATDAYGDGCPATQSILGKSGTGNYATATLPGPGVYGVSVDAYSDLFFGDTETNLVREIASGSQFGVVGANQPVDILDIHFAAGDSPAASAYTLTSGATNFSLGTATCTANSDGTTDCLLPVTATPTALGAFSGTLQVKSTQGGTGTFPLTGTYVVTPLTRTAVTINTGVTCTGATSISNATPVTLTATITSSGTPTGSVQFYANNVAIGMPVSVSSSAASIMYTFSTVGTYTITAVYSGDSYYKTSTGKATSTITTATPGVVVTPNNPARSTVSAGGTALYSLSIAQSVYTGTLTFACSGLPAYATCSFSPTTISGAGCTTTSVVAINVYTQQATPIRSTGFVLPSRGPWQALGILPGLMLAFFVGFRRRRLPTRFGQLGLAVALLLATSGFVACGSAKTTPGTPAFNGNFTVTATASTGTVTTIPLPLVVN